ncbi:hypothetical protein [Paenibacillus solani]|uniref:hypothetical protein n=1 Tax=Paenibacillus solani TaxID=1705565 RepID=UPI003D2A6252
MLPLAERATTGHESVLECRDIFIDTTYRFAAIYSSDKYKTHDKTASLEEIKSFISYDHISFSAYLDRGWANMLAVELIQEGKINLNSI